MITNGHGGGRQLNGTRRFGGSLFGSLEDKLLSFVL
jgi:hypothetical protein